MDDAITIELPGFDTRVPAPPPNPLAAEEAAFARLLPDLLKTHTGQYVAVFGGRVVGTGTEEVATVKAAYAAYGYCPILVQQVTDEPRVVRIPSVRVHRGS